MMMEKRSIKHNIIITGIQESSGENCELKVQEFLENHLKLKPYFPIKLVHRIRLGANRAMVLQFQNIEEPTGAYFLQQ